MISVLVIENEEEKILPLHKALSTFDNLNIVLTNGIDLAKEANSKQYFDFVFLDSSLEQEKSIKCIKNIKSYNPLTMIIVLANEHSQDEEHQFLSIGVKDFLKKSIHTELLVQRIENYIEIINFKKKNLFSTDVFNLFDKNVYQHMITFRLNSHTARVQFWDYFMVEHFDTYKHAKELVGILYALASWLFLNNEECEIVKETSNDSMYLTLFPISTIRNEIIENILMKNNIDVDYLKKDNKLSIKLEKINDVKKSFQSQEEKSEQQKILGKTHFNKITAAEFVEMTAVSYIDKIEDLIDFEDEIDIALLDFENAPALEKIDTISQKFIEYVEVIKLLVEFEHLVFALTTLAEGFKSITLDQLTSKEVKKFTTLMLHLLHDLSTWRDNIFVKQEANDIHYLDSSLLSSALQIETIFANKEVEEDDDSFELF